MSRETVVHYRPDNGRDATACTLVRHPLPWQATAEHDAVTCQLCRSTFLYREPPRVRPEVADDEAIDTASRRGRAYLLRAKADKWAAAEDWAASRSYILPADRPNLVEPLFRAREAVSELLFRGYRATNTDRPSVDIRTDDLERLLSDCDRVTAYLADLICGILDPHREETARVTAVGLLDEIGRDPGRCEENGRPVPLLSVLARVTGPGSAPGEYQQEQGRS